MPCAIVFHHLLRQSLLVRPGTDFANSRQSSGRDSASAVQSQKYVDEFMANWKLAKPGLIYAKFGRKDED